MVVDSSDVVFWRLAVLKYPYRNGSIELQVKLIAAVNGHRREAIVIDIVSGQLQHGGADIDSDHLATETVDQRLGHAPDTAAIIEHDGLFSECKLLEQPGQ